MSDFNSFTNENARADAVKIRLSLRKRVLAPLDVDQPTLTVKEFGLEFKTAQSLAGKKWSA